MRRVHHIIRIGCQEHIVLCFPETQGTTVHPRVRDNLLFQCLMFVQVFQCAGLIFLSFRRAFWMQQSKLRQLCRRTGEGSILKSQLSFCMKISMKFNQIIHRLFDGFVLTVITGLPILLIISSGNHLGFYFHQFHNGLCRIDDRGIISAWSLIGACLRVLAANQIICNLNRLLQILNRSTCLIFID